MIGMIEMNSTGVQMIVVKVVMIIMMRWADLITMGKCRLIPMRVIVATILMGIVPMQVVMAAVRIDLVHMRIAMRDIAVRIIIVAGRHVVVMAPWSEGNIKVWSVRRR